MKGLTENEKTQIRNISRKLQGSFIFSHTKQGHSYWYQVCDNLDSLIEDDD